MKNILGTLAVCSRTGKGDPAASLVSYLFRTICQPDILKKTEKCWLCAC